MTKPSEAGGGGRLPSMPSQPGRPAPDAHGAAEGPRQYPPAEAARQHPGTPAGPSDVGNAAKSVAEQTQEQARTLASEAKDQTADLAGRAQHQVGALMADQKNRAAEGLGSLAGALREVAGKLGHDEIGRGVGHYAQRAATQVDSMSSYLRGAELQAVVRDTGRFARRRPEVFIGGAFLAGLVAARFLKASSSHRRAPDGSMGGY
jgi:hypothetical protein